MKKIIILMIIVCALINVNVDAMLINKNNIHMNEEEVINLERLGFDELEIQHMDQEEFEKK